MAGVERGTALLARLAQGKEAWSSSDNEEKIGMNQSDDKIMDSINSVRESLNLLEGTLEAGQNKQTKHSTGTVQINLTHEKTGLKKKREQKLMVKARVESN